MKNSLFGAMVAAIMLASAPAVASTTHYWNNNNFDVSASNPGESPACLLEGKYHRAGIPTTDLVLLLDRNGPMLGVFRSGWSVKENESYEGFSFVFANSEYEIADVFRGEVSGLNISYRPGFGTRVNSSFLDHFGNQHKLVVMRKNEQTDEFDIVADFGLAGSAAAVSALRRCYDHVSTREDARIRRERANDYIAKDPFSNR